MILYRNSYGLIVTFLVFFGYIWMLLYHYKVSAEATDSGGLTQDRSEDERFHEHFIFVNFLIIAVLMPFARNHKLR